MAELNHDLITSHWCNVLLVQICWAVPSWFWTLVLHLHGSAWCRLMRLGQPRLGKFREFSGMLKKPVLIIWAELIIIFESTALEQSISVVLETSDL